MDHSPRVSVYIPTRDRHELLKRAIDSVAKQDYHNIEIIIADDGSNPPITHNLFGCDVIIHRNNTPRGACAARNQAIKLSTGEFITGLDDDDYFQPNRISSFVRHWQPLVSEERGSDSPAVAGLFDSCSVIPFAKDSALEIRHQRQTVNAEDLLELDHVGTQIFAPRKHWLACGGFDPDMPAWQDWDLWIRMAKRFGAFHNINQCSYVIDESHGLPRISGSPRRVRLAQRRFEQKHAYASWKSRLGLLLFRLTYPGNVIDIDGQDALILAMNGRFRTLLALTLAVLRQKRTSSEAGR